MQQILSLLRKAADDYKMIDENDKIVVGCSGGKDSTLLLVALSRLSRFYPKKFSVVGISLDMGSGMDFSPLIELCERENIELIIKKTEISKVIFDVRKESNPCSLCAKMRRGVLNGAVVEIGANKVALGHHMDDVIETFALNLIHEGRIDTFSPVTYLSRKNITVIRPFIYLRERDIQNAVNRLHIPVLHNPCAANGKTERQSVKIMLNDLETRYNGVKKRIFGAIERSELNGWKKHDTED